MTSGILQEETSQPAIRIAAYQDRGKNDWTKRDPQPLRRTDLQKMHQRDLPRESDAGGLPLSVSIQKPLPLLRRTAQHRRKLPLFRPDEDAVQVREIARRRKKIRFLCALF